MIDFTPFFSSSAGNLYRACDGETPLLIECGVSQPKIRKALDFKLSEIAGCLLSHCHLDHARAAADIMRAGVELYCSRETAEALRLEGHRLNIVEPRGQFALGSWTVLPFEAEHDCPGALGFLLASGGEKLLFLADSFYCRYRFDGLNVIAIECNYSLETLSPDLHPEVKKRLLRSHFSLENVLKFLAANDLSQVREIHLLHLSEGNSDARAFKAAVERATGKPTFVAEA